MAVLAIASVCAMALTDFSIFSQLHHFLFFTHRQHSGFHVGYTSNYKCSLHRSETERRLSVLFIVWIINVIGHTRATKHTCQSHVPILLVTWAMGGFKQKVLSSKLRIRSRWKYLEIKAEMLISCLIFIFWCQTQMFSVYSKKKKGIGLTVPILLEGSVYIYIYIYIYTHTYRCISIN